MCYLPGTVDTAVNKIWHSQAQKYLYAVTAFKIMPWKWLPGGLSAAG